MSAHCLPSRCRLGTTRSPFYSAILLTFLAAGAYSFFGPFWTLPSEFLTGFSAAAGIALINSVGALGGFAGPYMIGAIAMRTGNLYAGLALAGVPVFASAMLVLFLPRRARALEKGLVVRTEAERLDGLLAGPGADEVRQRGSCSRRLHFTLKPL